MKMKLFILTMFLFIYFFSSNVFAFEIIYPNEKGFFIGAELPYQTINSKQEKQEGTFIFGQSKIIISEKEYYDCVFSTAIKDYHFYFALDPSKQVLLFKGLKMGLSEINTSQPATSFAYPLFSNKKWTEDKIEILGKNIEIPGLGILPTLTVKNVKASSFVASDKISVPAGEFETLLVETIFSGDVLNIPVSIAQRTWLSQNNVIIKMNFEFQFLFKVTPIFDMELVTLTSANLQSDKKISSQWGFIKK